MIISYDFGHMASGADTSANGIIYEYSAIRTYAPFAVNQLMREGHTLVNCTPTGNMTLDQSLGYRVDKANASGSQLHLCFHVNAFQHTASPMGAEIEIASDSGVKYATPVLNEIVKLDFKNRGIKRPSLFVTRNTKMPAILIEPFFCDSVADCNLYNPETLGLAIARGITSVIGGNSVTVAAKPIIPVGPQFNINMVANIEDVGITKVSGINSCKIGTIGKAKRLEMFSMTIDKVDFTYSIHEENVGDEAFFPQGSTLGTVGVAKRIEGITINISNITVGYKLQYRANIQNLGLTSWMDSGAYCGTKDKALRVEEIEVQIIKA